MYIKDMLFVKSFIYLSLYANAKGKLRVERKMSEVKIIVRHRAGAQPKDSYTVTVYK
jgi:hypothetical protein